MDSQLEQQFFDFLVSMGFPKSSIIYEPAFQTIGIGRKYRPDFAILDPRTNEPLAIIEIKGLGDPEALTRAAQQLYQYISALSERSIRAFIVTAALSGVGFDFYTLAEDGKPKQVPSSSFLEFESLASARVAEKREILAEEKKETTDQFLFICFSGAGFSLVITIADFICSCFEISLLTTERMSLIGFSFALIIIPYVQKFKGLGIEIERASKPAKD